MVAFISPNHNLELYANECEVFGVTIEAPYNSPNTDAIDIHGACVIVVGEACNLITAHRPAVLCA